MLDRISTVRSRARNGDDEVDTIPGLAPIGFTQWDLPHSGRLILEPVRESEGRLGEICTGGEW